MLKMDVEGAESLPHGSFDRSAEPRSARSGVVAPKIFLRAVWSKKTR